MDACSIQLSLFEMPLLDKPVHRLPEAKYEWYTRIASHIKWEVIKWDHDFLDVTFPSKKSVHNSILEIQNKVRKFSASGHKALILDFSSYEWFRHGDWDAMEGGWNCLDPFTKIVLIWNEYATVEGSDFLIRRYKSTNNTDREFIVMDPRGTVYDLNRSGNNRRQYVPELREYIGTVSFKQFLRLILRKSRRHFGHFETVSGAHVRTHYDISPLVCGRSQAYEHIATKLSEIYKQEAAEVVVCCGIGRDSLQEMRRYLNMDISGPVEYYDEYSASLLLARLSPGVPVILMTDVVLTGKTVSSLSSRLIKAGANVKKVFSVIALENSAKSTK